MTFPLADLEGLTAALGDLLAPAWAVDAQVALSHADLLQALRAVEQLGRWADSARLVLAGEVGRRVDEGCGDEAITVEFGCRGAAELVERATLVSAATARARVRDARMITSRMTLTGQSRPAPLSHVRAALAAGRLGADALATIAGAIGPPSERCGAEEIEAAETELVAVAVGDPTSPPCGIHELRVMAETWALFLDPDGVLPDDEYAERMRGLRVSRRSRRGLRRVSGDVAEDVAAQLDRLLDAHLNPRVRESGPRFGAADEGASPIADLGDVRTVDQKRHDAFASILSAAAVSADSPTLGGAAPVLVVTTTEADLADRRGVAFVETAAGPVAVSSAIARHVGCHGTVQRVTLGAGGRITALRVEDRVFNHWQRRAIAARDGGCIIPGCTVPAAWCEVHHVIEHARGGPTDSDNGVLLCWHHHRGIETSGWEIRMVGGAPEVRPPGWIDPARRWRPPNRVVLHELRRARTG